MSASTAQNLLSVFWTPLVVVTADDGTRRAGQVAVSVHGASIIPDRPRLSVGLWKTNHTRDVAETAGAFAVHLVRDDQDELIYRFGLVSSAEVDKFAGLDVGTGITGAPLLRDCLAVYECRVVGALDAGDHTLFLADVVAMDAPTGGDPLWWRDLRPRMPPEPARLWQERAARNIERSRPLL